MKLKTIYILTGIFLVVLIIGSDVFGYKSMSYYTALLISPAFGILYFWKAKIKTTYFSLFVGLYAVGDVVGILDAENVSNFMYYVCNTIFILAYAFLFFEMIRTIVFKKLFKHFKLELITLILLFIYMIYVLINIIKPVSFETNHMLSVQIFELIYNIIVILVLISSFLNYIQNTNRKYLILFIGCAFLVFSELILIGYYYMVDDIRLSYMATILYISGFILVFYQSQIANDKK